MTIGLLCKYLHDEVMKYEPHKVENNQIVGCSYSLSQYIFRQFGQDMSKYLKTIARLKQSLPIALPIPISTHDMTYGDTLCTLIPLHTISISFYESV